MPSPLALGCKFVPFISLKNTDCTKASKRFFWGDIKRGTIIEKIYNIWLELAMREATFFTHYKNSNHAFSFFLKALKKALIRHCAHGTITLQTAARSSCKCYYYRQSFWKHT